MNKIYATMLAAALPAAMMAQSAIDAQLISQPDLKGTARFMSMGGAFTALGGDLSTLNQNPAGIGIYRSNEVGITLDINMQNSKTESMTPGSATAISMSQTKAYCNNFGYVGATRLDGPMRTFNWGVSYNRAASFDRVYQGYVPTTQNSLSNYIAAFTTASGVSYNDMEFGKNYNPYLDSNIDWLSTLAYSAYMISPYNSNSYEGLYKAGTVADAAFNVRETGRIDEYDINFGGNVENVVYWGLGIGITDLDYTRTIFYSESLENARIYDNRDGGTTNGNAGFDLSSRKYITGNGWNLKLGVILKPVNELRIGLAVHTPTWYSLTQGYDGIVDYSYFNPDRPQVAATADYPNPLAGNDYTENAYFNWHFRAPWKFMAGIAGVIGNQAIVSLDYQYEGFNNMSIATPVNYNGFNDGFQSNEVLNGDIKDYYQGASTVRVGVEYRVTPQFSLRAGYNAQKSNVKQDVRDGLVEVFTSGTDPSYSFDKLTQYITCGLGYRYKAWYIDAAYVYKNRESTFHAYTNYDSYIAPSTKLTDHNSSIVLSTGFKF